MVTGNYTQNTLHKSFIYCSLVLGKQPGLLEHYQGGRKLHKFPIQFPILL